MNSIPLSRLGYNVTGVDYSTNCVNLCKKNCPELNLIQSDIRTFFIENNKYDLIMSRRVLHFLHKNDVYEVIENIKNGLKPNGIAYINVFSVEDPKLAQKEHSKNLKFLKNNMIHHLYNDTYVSFFSKKEILSLFKDFKTLCISEEYSLEQPLENPHYDGIIRYIGQKIK